MLALSSWNRRVDRDPQQYGHPAGTPGTVKCVREYLNGERKTTYWTPQEAEEWVQYNLAWRPGNALFVNGVCRARGYLSEERVSATVVFLQG